ncbi:MAG: hypothetical protein JXA06_06225 [Bacteroidetes bacterium]|nr:hypothetical protein [Bacteroidota bacterium]
MNKMVFLTVFFILPSITVFGQKNGDMDFDFKDFFQKDSTARWLCIYDKIAWWTSDSVMNQSSTEIQRLGGEWFCFQTEDSNWHAAFGKYKDGKFDLVFHYLVDTENKVSRIYEVIDTNLLNTYSRALITAKTKSKIITDSTKIRFNQYIRQNEDNTLTVWILPAFQPDGLAVFGGEFIYKIDRTGNIILEDSSYYQGQFRGIKVNKSKEVWIDYTELEKPTLGGVFFVWYYNRYFAKINLNNKNYVSTIMKILDENSFWVHVKKHK